MVKSRQKTGGKLELRHGHRQAKRGLKTVGKFANADASTRSVQGLRFTPGVSLSQATRIAKVIGPGYAWAKVLAAARLKWRKGELPHYILTHQFLPVACCTVTVRA